MTSTSIVPFRFRDLPSEIRNKIYRNLFCEFSPPPTTVDPSDMFSFERAQHSIETALLRTSTDIYREAYDVLIKTNRFVKITSVKGFPLRLLINGLRVPVVAETKAIVQRFKGYVLAVHLDCNKTLPIRRDHESAQYLDACTIMILHRDLETFCQALTDGGAHAAGFSESIQISITMAPVLDDMPRKRHTPSLENFFSKKTQETLVAPFRRILRGYKGVTINGRISKDLAKAVYDDMAQEHWLDWESVLEEITTAKEDGSRLFQDRKNEQACLRWQDAVVDIDKMHESSSWANLARLGGGLFIAQVAELYFLMRLNVAHIQIANMHNPIEQYFAGLMAEDALNSATRSLKKGFWVSEYKYTPSIKHLAKLRYRYAMFMRLQAEPGTADRALMYIDKALSLQPGDAAIIKERQKILAWTQRV